MPLRGIERSSIFIESAPSSTDSVRSRYLRRGLRLRLPGLTLELEVRVELLLLALLAHGIVVRSFQFTFVPNPGLYLLQPHVVQGTEGNSGLLAFWAES